ncbi:MAG: cell division protein FtsQ/DivIB [Coriobacteriia bacterium]
MASTSGRKSGSSDRSTKRKRVTITARQSSHGASDKAQRKVKGSVAHRRPHPKEVTAAAKRRSQSLRDQRERRLKQQSLKIKLKVIGYFLLSVAVVVGAVALYRAPVFSVTRIDVIGNRHLSEQDVRNIVDLPADATLLRLPIQQIDQRLEANPWIASATVSRDFPDAVRIRVQERVPAALVDVGTGFWIVDENAWAIAPQSADVTTTLVVVRDVPDFEPGQGKRSESSALRNALSVWSGLSEELHARTRLLSAPSVDKTAIVTIDDIEVFVGSAEDMAKKDLVIRRILAEQAGKVVYINVRTVDRPTWRGIDSP